MTITKTRLMQITHDLAIGGLQQVVVTICKFIDRQEFDVSVLCLRALGPLAKDIKALGIPVFCLPPKKSGTDYFSFLKVARILRREQIDVIHTHNTQPFLDGTLGGLLAGVKTIIHTDHARNFPDKKRYMFAERMMSQFAYKIVGVSEHTCGNLINFERISPRKLMVIPNGIDSSSYSIHVDKEAKRRELGVKLDGPIIGLGARLTEAKGIRYLLQAMPVVIGKLPNLTLVIAGDGPLESSLKNMAADLRITANVLFIGQRLDMPKVLNVLDLYVLPSLSEGLPMALLEAMAAGCPIVATDVGGISTAIQNGVSGSLVAAKDPGALAEEIVRLLENTDLARGYIEKSQEAIHRNFGGAIMSHQYEELYRRRAGND